MRRVYALDYFTRYPDMNNVDSIARNLSVILLPVAATQDFGRLPATSRRIQFAMRLD